MRLFSKKRSKIENGWMMEKVGTRFGRTPYMILLYSYCSSGKNQKYNHGSCSSVLRLICILHPNAFFCGAVIFILSSLQSSSKRFSYSLTTEINEQLSLRNWAFDFSIVKSVHVAVHEQKTIELGAWIVNETMPILTDIPLPGAPTFYYNRLTDVYG